MNEFTSLGREVFVLFYAKATWRCLQGGKAAEQFRPFYFTIMKYLYLKLLLLVLFEAITVQTSALNYRIDGILYSLSGNEAIVAKTEDAYLPLNANVVIPSSITYNNKSYTVTGINGSAFYFSSRLTSISIPKTIRSIGKKAFSGCSNLKKVIVEDIDSWCKITFEDASANPLVSAQYLYNIDNIEIKQIKIPDGITSVGNYIFYNCKSITSVEIPNEVTTIGVQAFYDCSELTSIIMPKGLTTIGDYAFYDCSGLTSITMPENLTIIGKSAFDHCNNLEKVIISNIGNWCDIDLDYWSNPLRFAGHLYSDNNTEIVELVIPEGVKSIGKYTFAGCKNITGVKFPKSLISIGEGSFYECYSIDSVVIPETVQEIGSYAFYNCSALTYVSIPKSIKSFDKGYGLDFFKECNNIRTVFLDNNNLTSSTISIGGENSFAGIFGKQVKECILGNSIVEVGLLFEKSIELERITIPSNVTKITENAFQNCMKLETLDVNTKTVGNWFNGLASLTTVILGNNMEIIDDNAFSNCTGLTSINLPSNLKYIGNSAFKDCLALTHIVSADGTETGSLEHPLIVSQVNNIANAMESNIISEADYYVIGKISSIKYNFSQEYGTAVFNISDDGSENSKQFTVYSCYYYDNKEWVSGDTQLKLGDVVIICGKITNYKGNTPEFAEHKSYIVSINDWKNSLPNSITSVGNSAFTGCTSLTNIIIPNSVKDLGASAFSGCSQLAEVTLSNGNLTDIGAEAFSLTALASIALPDGLKTLGKKVFADCKQLSDVTMTNSVENISESAFAGCENLKNITLSENLNQISDGLFKDCSSISAVTIPSKITSIGANAFENCSSIISVNIPSSLTTIGKDAFEGCNSLNKVIVSDMAAWCGITFANSGSYNQTKVSNPLSIAHHLYNEDGTEITDLIIPEGVETINSYAFYGGSNFTSVKIPSSLKKIGDYSFKECDNLSKVIVPDLTSWCNINFGSNYNSNPLSISGHLYSDNEHEIFDLVIPYGVTNISEGAFNYGKFSSVAFPGSLKTIGNYAFSLCSNITSVVIPNGVTTIGMGAFGLCDKLAAVVIPNSVSSIGKSAFANCLSLYSVTSLINIPFNLDESAFQYLGSDYDKNIIYMAATLYVPRGRNAMYGNVQGWKNFMNIMESDTKYNLTYMLDGEVYKNYEIQATEVITPESDPYREGYEFSGWSTIPSVMPAHDVVVTGSFTPSAGISSVLMDENSVMYYYTIDGKRINTPQRGINIIKMKDGSTKKIIVE